MERFMSQQTNKEERKKNKKVNEQQEPDLATKQGREVWKKGVIDSWAKNNQEKEWERGIG